MKKQNFQEALHSLIGFNVSIISDDKTVHDGVVLDVKSDFIVIQMNPDKPCYFNLNQVYALSKNTKEFQVQILDHELTQKQSFTELINELKGHWVTINRENNLSLDGFLSTVTNDYIVLLNKDKQLYIQLSNILYIFKGIENKESSENKQQENKDGKTENKQSESDQVKESDSMLMEDTEVNSKEKEEPVEEKQEQAILTIGKEEQPLPTEISAYPEVLSVVKEEPVEEKQEQAILTIGKEEQPLPTEISAYPEVLSVVKEEPVEEKQEQAILTIGKEGPTSPTERSTHAEVLSDVREEQTVQSSVNEVNKNQSNVKKSTNKYKKQKSTEKKKKSEKENPSESNPEISAHPEVLSNVREELTLQSTVNEVNKDQSNVIKKSADKKYKKQKSREKKKKEGKKENPSVTNNKDRQDEIQENLTEVFRNSSPQEMNEQSAKKNDLKEKRKLIDKKCYELIKSTEKMSTDNGNQKNEYYSLMKFAEKMHGKLKAKRSKP
ncbi:DUF2642 domain-containing protein [Peribacillus sp. AS_2]|uniref:DUF2642 domain-containing protein n=1 Tax=Peribacillus sp. AS_2 TaxID=2996755 RepID=UPI0022A6FAA8|nr:DUF2642 domain-containing protein [Peribacillus sp. AS_2]MCZ0875552.1 DUF2642 domain-containing protein [Peribacillus sp. AS_2]